MGPWVERIGSWIEVAVAYTCLFFLALRGHHAIWMATGIPRRKESSISPPTSELLLAVEAIIENSWLFIALGNKTMKALKTALLCPCQGDGVDP